MLYGVGLWILASFVALVLGGFLSKLAIIGLLWVVPLLYMAAWVWLIILNRERPRNLWIYFSMWTINALLSATILGGFASSSIYFYYILAGLPVVMAIGDPGRNAGTIGYFAVMLALCGLCVALLIRHYRANKRPKT